MQKAQTLRFSVGRAIVALTAHVLDTHRLEGMTAGMDDYLPKPVDSEQLYACLQRLIRSRAIQ